MVDKPNLKKPAHTVPKPSELKNFALNTHAEVSQPLTMSRREMLKYSAAWLTMAYGLAACDRTPPREIVSRTALPEYRKPGKELYYSSTWTEGAYPYGIMIKQVDGRPIKIEGNPDHPVNNGSTDAAMQASILSLYDPDRLRGPKHKGKDISWEQLDQQVIDKLKKAGSVILLTRSNLGPSERAIIQDFIKACPKAKHFVHEPVHDSNRRITWQKIFGSQGELIPKFSQAKVILSLDSDFLGHDGVVLENIREFALGRKVAEQNPDMSRLYVVEAAMSTTGSKADHRLRLRPSNIPAFVDMIRQTLQTNDKTLKEYALRHNIPEKLLQGLISDLQTNRGKSLVVAGAHLPAQVHAAVALLNKELDALGHTLIWNPSPATLAVSDPEEVAAALKDGVDVLICMGVNPVFDWYGDDFSAWIKKANLSIGHGLYQDETLSACDYALAGHHNLESWNDAAPREGLYSLCQPLIQPLHNTRQEAESILAWTRGLSNAPQVAPDWHTYVQQLWQRKILKTNEKKAWIEALRNGLYGKIQTNKFPALNLKIAEVLAEPGVVNTGAYELLFFPHHGVYDGRFANNPWLQELPAPASKLVWDNAVMISYETSKKLGVEEGHMLKIQVGKKQLDLPALVQPGVADDVLITTLGHGRSLSGQIGNAKGFNTYLLRDTSEAWTPWIFTAVNVSKSNATYSLVRTQPRIQVGEHKMFSMEERPIVLDSTLKQLQENPQAFVAQRVKAPASQLHEDYDYSPESSDYKWEMAIDLNACVGCNACMLACQSENNIPFVGKDECERGREMHWIRIDRYEDGDGDDPKVSQQPMLCQHCDNAPCETVCPVQATSHSEDGLNEMAYNRCVGTRYCANNCPYKVRRFNFYDYRDLRDPVQELAFNPNVTVRSRGVMEKCSFCVQRVNNAKFDAKNKGQKVADGTFQSACQQSCPAQAIYFGNANDPNSKIAQMKKSTRAFGVLEEINTRPGVTYMGIVRNPNEKV